MNRTATNANALRAIAFPITATEYTDGEQRTLTIIFKTDKGFTFPESVKNAVNEYLTTEAGKEYLSETNGCFNWGDVCNVPNYICIKHGFEIELSCVSDAVVDWNEQLISEEALC